jgi:hypothetical protein
MVHQACCHFNFDYVIFLMKLTQKYKISPNEQYMQHLEMLKKRAVETRRALVRRVFKTVSLFLRNVNSALLSQRKKKPVSPGVAKNPNFREDSLIFSDYFAQWKKEVDIFKSPHPYKQFAKSTEKTQPEEPEAKFSEDNDESTPLSDRWRDKRTRNNRRTKKTFANVEEGEEDESACANDNEGESTRKLRWNKRT